MLLSDPQHKVIEEYNCWGEKGEDEARYMGVIRSHYLISEYGRILDIQRDVSPEQSVERAVRTLLESQGATAEGSVKGGIAAKG